MGYKIAMSRTKLILLGTGTPNILPERYQSSIAVIVDDVPYIVDCGGGALQRMVQAVHEKDVSALKMRHLTRCFLTHLHPDHTTGLPDFLIAPWVLDRSETVRIWGALGTQNLVDGILKAYAIGIGEHRDGLAPINHPLAVVVTEIDAGEIYRDERVTVTAFRAQHGTLDAYSYQFVTPDKTIVISGDTTPNNMMMKYASGCDILVHEVYSTQQFKQRSAAWQAYHANAHTSTIELAHIANQTRPKLLVLVHSLFWGATEAEILAEIRQQYAGEVVCGRDLDIF